MITGITANTANKATSPFAVRISCTFHATIGDFGAEKSAKRAILVDLG
jgi:hypothetical protein